jgi:hypothetical protein
MLVASATFGKRGRVPLGNELLRCHRRVPWLESGGRAAEPIVESSAVPATG